FRMGRPPHWGQSAENPKLQTPSTKKIPNFKLQKRNSDFAVWSFIWLLGLEFGALFFILRDTDVVDKNPHILRRKAEQARGSTLVRCFVRHLNCPFLRLWLTFFPGLGSY